MAELACYFEAVCLDEMCLFRLYACTSIRVGDAKCLWQVSNLAAAVAAAAASAAGTAANDQEELVADFKRRWRQLVDPPVPVIYYLSSSTEHVLRHVRGRSIPVFADTTTY